MGGRTPSAASQCPPSGRSAAPALIQRGHDTTGQKEPTPTPQGLTARSPAPGPPGSPYMSNYTSPPRHHSLPYQRPGYGGGSIASPMPSPRPITATTSQIYGSATGQQPAHHAQRAPALIGAPGGARHAPPPPAPARSTSYQSGAAQGNQSASYPYHGSYGAAGGGVQATGMARSSQRAAPSLITR
jgi:hypothetical protein